MKITCESCAAQYDLDESRIPPSGVQMKCPACLHQFLVKKPAAAGAAPAAAARKEIALSEVDDDVTPLPPDLPGMAPPAPEKSQPSIALADLDGMDLPAPKKASGSAPAQGPNLDEIDL